MNFIKQIFKNKHLVFQLGKNEFKNRFANTSLGAIWGFINPFVFMITYVIVFQYILKTNSSGDTPYIVWFLPGMAIWMFLNDSIISGSSSIRNYSYLVKKVVFPIDVIPTISLISASIIGLFLILVSIIVCIIFGFIPNILYFIYVLISIYALIISITRLTSAICTLIPDFTQLLTVIMQLCFWFTPIVWNLNMLKDNETIFNIMRCMPFTYIVDTFRQTFTGGNIFAENNLIPTIVFWIFTIIVFILGNNVFERNKKDFADVL